MNINTRNTYLLLFIFITIGIYGCSTDTEINLNPEIEEVAGDTTGEDTAGEDEEESANPKENTTPQGSMCSNAADYIFLEKEGFVLVEFEDAVFTTDWKQKIEQNNGTTTTYMVWEGSQSLSNPGTGIATFKINIENPGSYQFIWYSSVKTGTAGSDHNDTWLRFNDATDFYAQNNDGTSTVYPKDTGKSPNPEGATKDGWFKIYRSGNNLDFKWQSSTFDNNAHNIFVDFDESGTYTMEVSARSSGHAIDKFVLFNSSILKADAISSTDFSTITCN